MKYTSVSPNPDHSPDCDGVKKEYRCTRPELYSSPNCPGNNNPSARQGHYTNACCPVKAVHQVNARLGINEWIDVQPWR